MRRLVRELGIRNNLPTRRKREARSRCKVAFGGTGMPRDEAPARVEVISGAAVAVIRRFDRTDDGGRMRGTDLLDFEPAFVESTAR